MAVYAPNYTIDVREWTWVTRVVSRPDGGESYAGAREILWSPLMRGGEGRGGRAYLVEVRLKKPLILVDRTQAEPRGERFHSSW